MLSATSMSFLPLFCEYVRSIANACCSVMECRSMRMPLARSMMARRRKAPSGVCDKSAACAAAFECVVLGEALEGDLDRALELVGVAVDDVGEDPAAGGLPDVVGVSYLEECDHRAGGLVDDLADQVERVR